MSPTCWNYFPGIGIEWHQHSKPSSFMWTAGTSFCRVESATCLPSCGKFPLKIPMSMVYFQKGSICALVKQKSWGFESEELLTSNYVTKCHQRAGQSWCKLQPFALRKMIMDIAFHRDWQPRCCEGCCYCNRCSHCMVMKRGEKGKALNVSINPINYGLSIWQALEAHTGHIIHARWTLWHLFDHQGGIEIQQIPFKIWPTYSDLRDMLRGHHRTGVLKSSLDP